jgi:hypothetical protein
MAEELKLAEIVSDDEISKVHGHANFGAMTPRKVVNDGVRKTAVGYHCGHTQFTILREHGLITKPRAGSYDADLTKKGKAYARVLYLADTRAAPATPAAPDEWVLMPREPTQEQWDQALPRPPRMSDQEHDEIQDIAMVTHRAIFDVFAAPTQEGR